MKKLINPNSQEIALICTRPLLGQNELFETVRGIIERVRNSGDKALAEFSSRFEGASLDTFLVSDEEFCSAEALVPEALKEAVSIARANIERFHRAQVPREEYVETVPGVRCWRKALPVERVGLYVPGGTAALFSTFLMLAIPAQAAGCSEIVVCSPPDKNGNLNPTILYIAKLLGIKNCFKVGGAQAIAAMAFGTGSIPRVDKICGPGNQYVSAAKQLVREMATVEIDMLAGPSEVLIIADKSCPPAYIASDLIAQAEHNPDSQVILLSTEEALIDLVLLELKRQLEDLPRKGIAAASLSNSYALCVHNLETAIDISNAYAPEHLILAVKEPQELAARVKNAGSVFLGIFSPEAAGDYASGTNHTLPTAGFARLSGGVSLDTFLKKITFQELSREGLQSLAPAICEMAEAEGLHGHSRSVALRFQGEES